MPAEINIGGKRLNTDTLSRLRNTRQPNSNDIGEANLPSTSIVFCVNNSNFAHEKYTVSLENSI